MIIIELASSRSLSGDQDGYTDYEVAYLLHPSVESTTAYSLVDALTPPSFDGLAAKTITIEPVDISHLLARVRYSRKQADEPEPDQVQVSVRINTETARKLVALDTEAHDVHGNSAPEVENFINVENGEPQGVDILVPVTEIELTVVRNTVTLAYVRTLASLTGTVNDADFYGFEAEELLYLGAQVDRRDDGKWTVRHSFRAGKTQNVTIYGVNITTKPFDYVWTMTERTEDVDRITVKPIAVYVQQIYPLGDFSELELP